MSATPSPPSSIDEQKDSLRHAMRAVRNNIPKPVRAIAADRVAVGGLDCLCASASRGADAKPGTEVNASVVAGYYPLHSEIDCLPLLAHLAARGWRSALPVVVTEDGPLEFRVWTPGAPLTPGKFRIPEPSADAPVVQPAVVLVPLLAFDAAGHRLGYGRGYYDRTIAALRRSGIVTAIGLAFDEQEVPQVPADGHDERLDWILSPSGSRPVLGRLPA